MLIPRYHVLNTFGFGTTEGIPALKTARNFRVIQERRLRMNISKERNADVVCEN